METAQVCHGLEMSDKDRYMQNLYRTGDTCVLEIYTGTKCGCWDYRGKGYSPVWHRNPNPGKNVPDCGGTGLLVAGRITTTVNLKAIIIPIDNTSIMKLSKEIVAEIGRIKSNSYYLVGSIDTDTLEFYSLSSLIEYQSKLIYDGKSFKVRHVSNVYNTGQEALLVQYE